MLKKHRERSERLYCTPSHITKALLRREYFPGVVWECAAGRGDIVRVLQACGYADLIASDLNDWGFRPCVVENFLASRRTVDCVVTNPPFDLKNEFLRHAKKLARHKIALLLPITFELTRTFIREHERDNDFGWKALYVFPQSIPWLNTTERPGRYQFGWFVFQRGYRGPVLREKIRFDRNPEYACPDAEGFIPYALAERIWLLSYAVVCQMTNRSGQRE